MQNTISGEKNECARINKTADELDFFFFFFLNTVYSKHRSHILVSLYQLLAHLNPIQIETHLKTVFIKTI